MSPAPAKNPKSQNNNNKTRQNQTKNQQNPPKCKTNTPNPPKTQQKYNNKTLTMETLDKLELTGCFTHCNCD